MPYGLPSESIEQIRAVFARHPELKQAILYGSRAMGTQREGSDIDLTLTGKDLNLRVLSRIETELDDLLLPYPFDLSLRRQIKNDSLLNHIERVGVLFYEKDNGDQGKQREDGMKEGWEWKKLGEVLAKTETTDPTRSPNAEFDYIDVSSVSNETLTIQETQRLKGKDAPSRARRLVRTNDILFATIRPTLRRIAIVPEELDEQVCSTGYFVLRATPAVDARFVFYFLQTGDFMAAMEKLQKGASYPAVTDGDVRSQPFPLPPLAEQRRIVGVLDEAFAGLARAKANAEQNLQNARALFASHLQAVFSQRGNGWVERTLGELCTAVEYGSSSKSKKEGRLPVLRMGNIQDGRLDWGNLVYSDNEAENERYQLKHNDVLFNRTNSPELVGKTAIYKGERPAIFAGYLIRIHRKEDLLDADYLNYFLNSRIAFDYGKTVVISSVNQANINGAKLKTYPIPTPPLPEQRRIATQLDALSAETQRLAGVYARQSAALAELKQALLHRAFAGAL
ncbi:MAG: restriction endonuclease subunit S [Verrucomicrobiaceae bacterium]|nr:restriction endonuclease subunit S [Verrucomicrobiaceae bacterium]